MDALALLCNLHADGPATLHRLRRAGCDSLAGVATLAPAELQRCLGADERAARRFQTEAIALAERLASGAPLEEPRASAASAERAPAAVEAGPPAIAGVERVLHAWKELDLAEPPAEPVDYVLPRPLAADAEPSLASLGLEGLTSAMLAGLDSAGIRSVRDLTAAAPVDLARITGLPFTRVKRLQFLARRREAAGAAEPSGSARSEPREPTVGDRLDAAGPFA